MKFYKKIIFYIGLITCSLTSLSITTQLNAGKTQVDAISQFASKVVSIKDDAAELTSFLTEIQSFFIANASSIARSDYIYIQTNLQTMLNTALNLLQKLLSLSKPNLETANTTLAEIASFLLAKFTRDGHKEEAESWLRPIIKVTTEMRTIIRDTGVRPEDLAAAQAEIERLKQKLADLNKLLLQEAEQFKRLSQEKEALERQKTILETKKIELTKLTEEESLKLAALKQQIQEKEEELKDSAERLKDLKEQFKNLEQEKRDLEKRLAESELKFTRTDADLKRKTQSATEATAQLQKLKTEFEMATKKASDDFAAKEKDLENARAEHQRRLLEKEDEYRRLSADAEQKHKDELAAVEQKRKDEFEAAAVKFAAKEKELDVAKTKHQQEIDAARAEHDKKLAEKDVAHKTELDAAEQRHKNELEAKEATHQKTLAEKDVAHKTKLAAAEQRRKQEIDATRAEHEKKLAEKEAEYQKLIADAEQRHKNELDAAAAKLEELQKTNAALEARQKGNAELEEKFRQQETELEETKRKLALLETTTEVGVKGLQKALARGFWGPINRTLFRDMKPNTELPTKPFSVDDYKELTELSKFLATDLPNIKTRILDGLEEQKKEIEAQIATVTAKTAEFDAAGTAQLGKLKDQLTQQRKTHKTNSTALPVLFSGLIELANTVPAELKGATSTTDEILGHIEAFKEKGFPDLRLEGIKYTPGYTAKKAVSSSSVIRRRR